MTASSNHKSSVQILEAGIYAAFPDKPFHWPITNVDQETNELFDEEQELFQALHEKKWTEISISFLKDYSFSIPLLTKEAFTVYLPAWLKASLEDPEIRRAIVITFDVRDAEASMCANVQALSKVQKLALLDVLTHALHVENTKHRQVHARGAIEFVRSQL
jgi:hypothetical protein